MSQSKFKSLALTLIAAAALVSGAHAAVVGNSSDQSKVKVGTSNITSPGGTHSPGRPGIAVLATGLSNFVDFQGLASPSRTDTLGVTTVDSATSVPTDHSGLGVFHFAKVAGANVYFGEWNQTAAVTDGTHTVYYAGEDGGNSALPAVGTATYNVQGINDYANKGNLTGTFTANITSASAGTLSGSLSGGGRVLSIGTATISGVNFLGTGGSYADGVNLALNGVVSGKFFGTSGQGLAGYITFANRTYNTAFGGAKQ